LVFDPCILSYNKSAKVTSGGFSPGTVEICVVFVYDIMVFRFGENAKSRSEGEENHKNGYP
jgi:hypothetical protein